MAEGVADVARLQVVASRLREFWPIHQTQILIRSGLVDARLKQNDRNDT